MEDEMTGDDTQYYDESDDESVVTVIFKGSVKKPDVDKNLVGDNVLPPHAHHPTLGPVEVAPLNGSPSRSSQDNLFDSTRVYPPSQQNVLTQSLSYGHGSGAGRVSTSHRKVQIREDASQTKASSTPEIPSSRDVGRTRSVSESRPDGGQKQGLSRGALHETIGPVSWREVDQIIKEARGVPGPPPNAAEDRKTGRDAETKAADKNRYRAKRALKRKEAGITVKFSSKFIRMENGPNKPIGTGNEVSGIVNSGQPDVAAAVTRSVWDETNLEDLDVIVTSYIPPPIPPQPTLPQPYPPPPFVCYQPNGSQLQPPPPPSMTRVSNDPQFSFVQHVQKQENRGGLDAISTYHYPSSGYSPMVIQPQPHSHVDYLQYWNVWGGPEAAFSQNPVNHANTQPYGSGVGYHHPQQTQLTNSYWNGHFTPPPPANPLTLEYGPWRAMYSRQYQASQQTSRTEPAPKYAPPPTPTPSPPHADPVSTYTNDIVMSEECSEPNPWFDTIDSNHTDTNWSGQSSWENNGHRNNTNEKSANDPKGVNKEVSKTMEKLKPLAVRLRESFLDPKSHLSSLGFRASLKADADESHDAVKPEASATTTKPTTATNPAQDKHQGRKSRPRKRTDTQTNPVMDKPRRGRGRPPKKSPAKPKPRRQLPASTLPKTPVVNPLWISPPSASLPATLRTVRRDSPPVPQQSRRNRKKLPIKLSRLLGSNALGLSLNPIEKKVNQNDSKIVHPSGESSDTSAPRRGRGRPRKIPPNSPLIQNSVRDEQVEMVLNEPLVPGGSQGQKESTVTSVSPGGRGRRTKRPRETQSAHIPPRGRGPQQTRYPEPPQFKRCKIIGPNDVIVNTWMGKIKMESDYIPPTEVKEEAMDEDPNTQNQPSPPFGFGGMVSMGELLPVKVEVDEEDPGELCFGDVLEGGTEESGLSSSRPHTQMVYEDDDLLSEMKFDVDGVDGGEDEDGNLNN